MTHEELESGLKSLDNNYMFELVERRYGLSEGKTRGKMAEFELWLKASNVWVNENKDNLSRHFLNWLAKNTGKDNVKGAIYGTYKQQTDIDEWERACIERVLSVLACGGYDVGKMEPFGVSEAV